MAINGGSGLNPAAGFKANLASFQQSRALAAKKVMESVKRSTPSPFSEKTKLVSEQQQSRPSKREPATKNAPGIEKTPNRVAQGNGWSRANQGARKMYRGE